MGDPNETIKQPSDEQIHRHVCDNWRDYVGDNSAFEDAEIDGCYDISEEFTDVFITVRAQVPWVDVEV